MRPEAPDTANIDKGSWTGSAADFLPKKITYNTLYKASKGCQGCDLYLPARQTVFGEGAIKGSLMLVGEQPGNEEDLEGHPFIGPAGKLLNKALEDAGIPRGKVYVTNAVKHFRFEERGQKRLHKSPSARQIKACRPWLDAEISLMQPAAILCLGATAAKSLLGANFSLTRQRGQWQPGPGDSRILATYHPSAALRAPDHDKREAFYKAIVQDLKQAATAV